MTEQPERESQIQEETVTSVTEDIKSKNAENEAMKGSENTMLVLSFFATCQ